MDHKVAKPERGVSKTRLGEAAAYRQTIDCGFESKVSLSFERRADYADSQKWSNFFSQ